MKREAALILGISPNANAKKIREAHKRVFFLNLSLPLLLPGEINISQLQGEFEFNTFLFDKPYN